MEEFDSGYDVARLVFLLNSFSLTNIQEMAATIRAFFKGRPLVANCITYGSLYMGAEFSQQTLLRLDHLFTSLACERAGVLTWLLVKKPPIDQLKCHQPH